MPQSQEEGSTARFIGQRFFERCIGQIREKQASDRAERERAARIERVLAEYVAENTEPYRG
jgi:hypothetical protein